MHDRIIQEQENAFAQRHNLQLQQARQLLAFQRAHNNRQNQTQEVLHAKLLEDYDRLIPKMKYNSNNKEIDEF